MCALEKALHFKKAPLNKYILFVWTERATAKFLIKTINFYLVLITVNKLNYCDDCRPNNKKKRKIVNKVLIQHKMSELNAQSSTYSIG